MLTVVAFQEPALSLLPQKLLVVFETKTIFFFAFSIFMPVFPPSLCLLGGSLPGYSLLGPHHCMHSNGAEAVGLLQNANTGML